MTECALNYAKDNSLKILPYSSFVAQYIEEHEEWEPNLHIKKKAERLNKKLKNFMDN